MGERRLNFAKRPIVSFPNPLASRVLLVGYERPTGVATAGDFGKVVPVKIMVA